ncbi:unnamed protein product [Adineta steineri]|uniref:EGF-like domain-containing protein n=1 Tax=Adineta steineri TaxID=433720 RepID=A0A814R515_9BILA|nr:unnamed protein product [Adineta steineri]
MLSYGKYQTSQLSSNITYVPRIYAQNFLAYSSMDDLLIFIEPKHQIHVYSAQTIQLIVNISTTDVVIASSCQSLISESPHELFFIYMNHSLTNLIGLRVCQVQFNIYKLNFIPNYCIELIKLQYDQPNLRLYGFTIKRDHAGTDKSLLFISTEIGIIYAIFETRTGVLSNEPLILNETLNEGSIVLSASNSIYYASKQEHLIYELRITRDFHLYYGNITKTNAIKSPFGLVADECNHLYIATRSMILIMYAQASVTIRSVFSKASDLPITLERLNATTYVYATIKRHSTKSRPYWMFNFLYFIGKKPEKNLPATRHPVFNLDDKLDVDIRTINEANIPVLYPLSYSLLSMTNATKIYTQFSSTQRQPFARFRKKKKLNTDQRNNSDEQEKSTTIRNDLSLNEQSKSDLPDEFQSNDFDDDLENIDDSQFDFPEPTTTPIIDEENQSEPTTEPATLENDSNKRKNLTSSHDESQEQSSDEQLISNQLTTTTINPQETRFPDTDLSQYFKTNENLSLRDKELLYNYLTKYPSSDSKSLNDTFHIGETLFTKNDLQSYLEGRTNLSQTQIAQIQNYLAQQLSSDPNRFLKNITSTKRPRIHDDHQHEQDQQGEDYLEELLPLDPTYLNSTKDLEKILFTIHDLRAYLQGNENLSPAQQKQIEAYLERQFSLNRTIFSKHPISENTHDAEQNTKLKDFLKKIPLINSTYFNLTTDSEQVFISKDDLQSYLQGQGNLSKTQEAQIQAYLAKQSASDQNIFSKYLTSTNKPKRPLIPGTNIYSDLESEGDQSEELLPLDLTHFNQTTHEEKLLFTTDDLKSYLKGRGNLSLAQQKQIEAYLERQSALNQTIFSKNPLTTKRPTIPFTSDEDIMLENLLNKMPVVDSKYYNISTNSEKILIPKDDLKLYLQGRGNLSKIQEAQVQTYIAEQSPSDQYILSKYLTSTVKPKTEEDHSFITDTHSKTYTEEELLSDLDYFERTTNSEERSFTIDDLRSYLLGHGNLSLTQKTQIEQYLAKQSPSNQNIFSKYLTTTTASGTIHDNYQNRNRKLEELLNKIPLVDSKYYNISTNTEHILIPKDDLKLYLQGQGNLSKIHEEQVKAYLAKQSLSDQKIFSSYFSSTKRPTENTEIDDYSDEVLPSDSTHLNHTITSEENLFSYDDLRSYLQGRGNFSDVQKAQIQAYLDEQSSSGQNIFSKFLKTTKPTTRIYSSDDRIPHDSTIEDKKLEDLLDKIPMIDSKHFNFSTELEQILISKDDLRSYLQGRQNLSKTQEEQVKAYFAKQSESDQEIFSQYLTSTIRPRTDIHPDLQSEDHSQELFPLDLTYFNNTEHPEKILFTVDDMKAHLQGQGNLTEAQKTQIEAYLIRQAASNQSLFSKYSTSTKPTTTIRSLLNNIYDDYQNDNPELQDFLDKLPQIDFNFSTGSEQILISKDDLRSYLQGKGNLSKAQEAQIEAYLATQTTSNQSISLEYLKTIKKPKDESYRNQSRKLEEFLNKIPMIDSKHFNISTGSEQVFISKDDLRSYLQGRGNLSKSQEAQIEAYLSRQAASNQSIFSKYSTTIKPTNTIHSLLNNMYDDYQNDNTELQDFLDKLPQTDSKYFNFSTGSEQILISKDDFTSYLQGRSNLTEVQKSQIEAYLATQLPSNQSISLEYLKTNKSRKLEEFLNKIPMIDSKHFNISTGSEQVFISKDDLRSYLQGRGNLTEVQKEQIEVYLARQAASNQSIFFKYSTSTKPTTTMYSSHDNIYDDYQNDNTELQDFLDKLPQTNSNYFNFSTGSQQILISKDDLTSYLQGRGNLTEVQKAQIEAYLATQLPSNQSISLDYLKTNKSRKLEEFLNKIPMIDSRHFNISTGSEQVFISKDDLRSYLQGRGNLTEVQKEQIEAYFATQTASNQSIFSEYLKTTKKPKDEYYRNQSRKLEDFLNKIPMIDSKHFNISTGSEQVFISKDDLRSYLQGRKNLSKIEEEQVKAYLAKQSESGQEIFSKFLTSTIKPRRPLIPGMDPQSDIDEETDDIRDENEEEEGELSPLDLTYFNNTAHPEKILFTVDDLKAHLQGQEHPGKILFTVDNLKAHLQGQGNLTEAQKAQIQAYLARQAASNQSIFSKYSTTNKPTTTMYSSHDNIYDDYQSDNTELQDFLDKLPQTDSNYFNFSTGSEQILISKDDFTSYLQGRGNLTEIQKEQIEAYLATQSPSNQSMSLEYLKTTKKPKDENYRNQSRKLEDLLDKVPMIDSKHFNISTGSEQVFISKDDLRSYLQGRGNLTEAQKAQIEAYFATQQASNQSIFSEYLKTTKKPKDENDRNQSRKLEDFLNKIPMIDSKHFNISTGSEKIFISKDDLRSYLQGRKNLSKIQEEQIKAYFEKQSESDQEIFSKFLTSTIKPRRPLLPGRDPQHDIDEETGDILDENEEGELLPLDLTYFNDTKNPGGILFNVDDLRSYLGGRGKLTEAQQAQIEAYLARQSSSNQSIFSKYSKTTRRPSKIFISDDNTYDDDDDDDLSQEIDLEDALNRIPIIDSKYFNFSTDSEKILISKDDLRAYLQGRTNLSKSQEVGIQTYLTKHTSVGNDTLFIFNATLTPAHRLRLWSQLFPSPSYLSTRSPKFTRLSSRKVVSEKTRRTTMSRNSNFNSTDSSAFTSTIKSPHKFSSKETMDGASTLHTAKQKLITTTSGDTFWSSSLRTHRSRSRSTTSSGSLDTSRTQSSKTISDQYTSKPSKDRIESSSSYRKSSEIPFNNDKTISTIVTSTLNPHGSSPIISEKTSAGSIITSTDKYNRGISDYRPWEVNEKQRISSTVSPWFTDKYHDGFNFDRSSFRSSTMYPYFYDAKTSSTFKQSFFDLYDPLSTTPERRYRTRKQKVIRWRTLQSSTSSPLLPVTLTTSIHDDKLTTSNPLSTWHSERTPLEQQQTIIIKPPITKNDSNIFFSNDYLNQIFQNLSALTNSSDDKFIYLNLIDHPPSSWNLSIKSNESITLDIALPLSINSTSRTNLTFGNIEANRFSTNIIGKPINLHVDRVHTKEFLLKMNNTNDDDDDDMKSNNHQSQQLSDVIIGHVKSEKFQLNFTKSDKMHVYVYQVDSATAELYFDSSFCTNDSSLEINLNLSENGTIRYGNRTPIHIGPVFTRVHMLKHSCERNQPLLLYFDICQRQNPCTNNGTCVSIIPDYNDTSYTSSETGDIDYKCNCPLHTSGDHCQYLEYPFGFCLNGGTVYRTYDIYNKSVEKCLCPIGFYGDYCEENVDNCIGISCSNHGICEDGINAYHCSCYDGFYGSHCERKKVQTVILQAASRSFGIIAILLIFAIAGLVIASDIHTYITRKHERSIILNKLPRVTSEIFENSVLLLGFGDAPIEMNDLATNPIVQKRDKPKSRQIKRTTRNRKPPNSHRYIARRRRLVTLPKSSSGR